MYFMALYGKSGRFYEFVWPKILIIKVNDLHSYIKSLSPEV